MGILIEHYGGAFPLWLAPKQIRIIPVHQTLHLDYALKVKEAFESEGLRVSIDDRNEKLGYRIREAQIHKIPIQIVVGDGEMNEGNVNIRRFASKDSVSLKLEDAVKQFKKEVEDKEYVH